MEDVEIRKRSGALIKTAGGHPRDRRGNIVTRDMPGVDKKDIRYHCIRTMS